MLGKGSPTGVRAGTSCNALLRELQQLWTDIGETEAEKDRMLFELEQVCLDVYRKKVGEAANAKARLHQSVATQEAELLMLVAALGELNIHSPMHAEKKATTLKEQLTVVTPLVEDLKIKKEERIKQFADIKAHIEKIAGEISEYGHVSSHNVEDQDLSLRKLTEYQSHLRTLQKEKSERLQKVLDYVNEVHTLRGVLGLDFGKIVSDVHPSLHGISLEQSTNISNGTLEGLEQAILRLKTERKIRFQKLKDIIASLFELWNLMDSTKQDKSYFSRITSILRLSETDIVEPEVERLTRLKASRMKELVLKKRSELEDICYKSHIEPDPSTAADKSIAMIDSGLVDPSELLANIEAQIVKAKDEALSRKEIMDRIERWLSACDEENWLEDYNQDENRLSAGRGVHINLKRAERPDNKLLLSAMARLVTVLEDYKLTRQQKEEEKKRSRDQKKLQDMLLTEKESIYGSKPSPRRSSSFRKVNGYHTMETDQ
ncbi:hypothetical protein RJ639_024785 [Escallonia herrerae]|uniref:Uncharacterized protein n=1 Tax=Escallonia herrerae TaxID=1293975 RepID=A0AA88UTC7_9ASTE|nr:hypothetical protein RJ639_024785 [Escallonia herrerae]